MNLVIQKLQEINEMIDLFKKKERTTEEVLTFVSLVNAAHKWANLAIQAYAVDSKNRRVLKDLSKMNIMDGETALEISVLPEHDPIKCREKQDTIITREECLDYSGSHNEECRDCDQFQVSRERLLAINK